MLLQVTAIHSFIADKFILAPSYCHSHGGNKGSRNNKYTLTSITRTFKHVTIN
jgi:hypothetical protein